MLLPSRYYTITISDRAELEGLSVKMKRKKHTSGDDDAAVDMTPMLDIVFIMLIFFIVTTTFSSEKGLEPTRPPKSDTPPPPNSKSLSIRIDASGQIIMAGRIVDIRRVVANAQTYLANNDTDTAAIQADEDTQHGVVVSVMDQIKLAGITKISVLVKE
ncbi:MAG: biopolymer transport protein ExbD [Gammaproteobacteria bacterium]|jgi:biopolymer transport protein ExbD